MVMKAMGVFTGVQVINILCSIVRVKLVAIWLGPVGVGLIGIYNSALETINSVSQLGLRNSGVRDVAAADGDIARLARISRVLSRWTWCLAAAGAFVTLVASPWLSEMTFGDRSHTMGFIVLSVAVFFSGIASGPLAVLQGMRKLRQLARASVWGALGGLAASVPMYYFWGIDSVVPSIAAYAIITYLASWLMRQRLPEPDPSPSRGEIYREGLGFVKLGIFMTASMFLTMAANYVFLAFLNWRGGTAEVGYYQAGYTIVTRYIGLVFTAIVMEYYPRLSQVSGSRKRLSVFASHEMLLGVVVIVPCAAVMTAADTLVLRLMYDSEFAVVAPYLNWALAGTVLRAVSWCMAIVILAKGDGRTYLVTEMVSALLFVGLGIGGWQSLGLRGLGIAYLIWYAAYTLIVGVVYYRRYGLRLNRNVVRVALCGTLTGITCALLRDNGLLWPVIAIAAISSILSLFTLRRLMR